jgi:hypothetical protein
MLFAKLATTFALFPLLLSGHPAVEVVPQVSVEAAPPLQIAQTEDPFAKWIFLYEDTFENNAGQEVTQEWWLEPNSSRQNNVANFTLLARRSPISSNGTAAAIFDYVADCETMSYTIEQAEFLDSNDATLDVQTYQRVMDAANPEEPFYEVLEDICGGAYYTHLPTQSPWANL